MRIGQADCEIWFGAERGDREENLLFHDYVLPVSSPENTDRIFKQPNAEALEGFPLLHLDCYTFDAGAIGWQEWISKYGHRRTGAGRGISYHKVMHALEAVYANAGFMVCGLALVRNQIDDGTLSLAFPIEQGARSKNAYRASFRESAIRRANIEQFREWLLNEAAGTEEELRRLAGGL